MEKNKEEDKVVIEFQTDKIMKLKDIVSSLKTIAILGIFFSSIISIVIVVLGTLTTLSISTSTKEQLLNNDSVIDFVSRVNNYSVSGAKDALTDMGNKTWFIIFDVVIPSLIILVAFILLIIFSIKLLNFIKDVKSNKSLFTEKKLVALKKVRSILLGAGLLFFIAFDFSYFIMYLILEITLEIILYLFNYCVKNELSK